MIGLEQMTPAGQENTEPVVMPDDEVLYELADLFRVFGDSTRIKILYALHDNELCVQDIANAVQLSQSAVSHQLRVLKDTKLVRFRRDGKTVYYALDDDHVRSILSMGMDHIEESTENAVQSLRAHKACLRGPHKIKRGTYNEEELQDRS